MEGGKADPRIMKTEERRMKTLMRMGVNPCSYRSRALPTDVQTFTGGQWGGAKVLKPISLMRKLGPAEAAGPQTEGDARAPRGPPQGHRSPGPLWSLARELCSGWPARGQLEGGPPPRPGPAATMGQG